MNKKGFGYSFFLFLISACAPLSPIVTPIATETYIAVDGMAVANIFTWDDANGNGVPDEGEFPIPFVTASIGYPDILTDSEGKGSPSEFMPGCAEDCSEGETLSVKVPPGYKPTTPTKYALTGDKSEYLFGFHTENEDNNLLFSNEPEWQKAFINRGAKVLAFHYSDNNQLEITLDREGTVTDDYYPESFLTDRFYFDVFVFDIILNLNNWHNVDISEVQITLMPRKSVFSCNISDIDKWKGRISGDEILTKHCEQR